MAIDWSNFTGGGNQGGGYSGSNGGGGGYYQSASPSSGFNWQDFLDQRAQVQQANQQLQQSQFGQPSYYQQAGNAWQPQQDYNLNKDRGFSLSGGTDSMFSKYRKAEGLDVGAIEAEKAAKWWNQLPANLTGNQNLVFDTNKFDLGRGLADAENLKQLRNFAVSLPGQMVGGLFEGAGDLYEAASGRPINEFRESKGGGYEIPDYEMDASQRAADFIDAGINLGGTFTGGSGRLIGGAGKLIGAGAKAAGASKVLNNMSKGVVTRAFEGARGGKQLGTGLGIMADVGDEAVEEFVQSWAEDVRNKNVDEGSMDRALTGAAWGALGGGIMGGAGRGFSAVANRIGNPQTSTQPVASDVDNSGMEPNTERGQFDQLRRSTLSKGMVNNVMYDAVNEMYTQHRDAPGSGVFKQIGTNADLDFDSIVLGSDNIRQIFYSNDRSAEKIASDFGTTVDVLETIFSTSPDVAASLNSLLEAKGAPTKVAVGRNPDTKNGGYYLDIDSVVNGQAFITHPMVAGIVGSDWDGDQSSVYFDPDSTDPRDLHLDALGYASQMLMSNEGSSNVDWWYAGFDSHVRSNREAINDIIKGYLGDYSRKFQLDGAEVDATTYFTKKLSRIIDNSGGNRNLELSQFFTELAQTVDDMNQTGEIKADADIASMVDGRRVVNRVLHEITGDTDAIVTHYVEYQADQVADNLRDMEGVTEEQAEEISTMLAEWDRRGTLGDKTKVFQLTRSLGLLSYVLNEDGNAPYRQYGQLYYMAKSVPAFSEMMTDIATYVAKPESVVTQLIRSSFKMPQAGQSPASAVESLCDTLALSEVFVQANLAGDKVRNAYGVKRLVDAVVAAQRKYALIYDDCQKKYKSDGFGADIDSKYRNPLPEDSGISIEFMRQFNKMFDGVLVDDIFARGYFKGIDTTGMTWGEFIEFMSNDRISGDPALVLAGLTDPSIRSFVQTAINERGTEKNAMVSRMTEMLDSFALGDIVKRYDDNGGHLDPNDVPAILGFMDAIQLIVDPELAVDIGLFDPDFLLGTKIGRMLFSGDTKQMLNALTSASIYGQFHGYIDMLDSDSDSDVQIAEDNIRILSTISPLHKVIADSILEDGNRQVFDWFTDIDLEWDYKLSQYEDVIGQVFPTGNYVIDSLRTGNSDFDLSSVSARMTKARSAIDKANRLVQDTIRGEVAKFRAYIETAETRDKLPDNVMAYVQQRCRDVFTRANKDILGMKIYASMTLDNSFVEKAVNADVEVAMYMANQLGINGGIVSHIDMITGAEYGHISKLDWASNRYHILACLSDPEYRQEVWDPDTGKVTIMTQQAMFEDAVPGFKSGTPITSGHVLALLDKYPQIAGYLCEGGVNASMQQGGISVQASRATSLTEDFKRFMASYGSTDTSTDPQVEYHMTRALDMTESWLYDRSEAHKIVTLMLDPENIEGHITPERMVADANRKMKTLARFVYYRALRSDFNGDPMNRDARSERARFRTNVISSLTTDLWRSVAYANEQLVNSFQLGSTDSMMVKLLYTKLGNMRMAQYLKDNYGLFVDVDQTSFTEGEVNKIRSFSERLRESTERTMRIAEMMLRLQTDTDVNGLSEVMMPIYDRNMMAMQIRNELQRQRPNEQIGEKEIDDLIDDAIKHSIPDMKTEDFSAYLLGDDDFASPETLKQKLMQLYSHDPDLIDGIDGDVEKAFPKGVLNAKAKRDLMLVANMNVVRNELNEVAKLNGVAVNENALQLGLDTLDSIDTLVHDFRVQMDQEGRGLFTRGQQQVLDWYQANGYSPGFLPSMDFLSEAKQSSITQQSVMDQAAGNPVLVGTNGGMGKKVYPLGHLKKSLDPEYSNGVEVSVSDLRLFRLSDYREWNAVDGNGNVVPVNTPAFTQWLMSDEAWQQGTIICYDPDDNPHGLPTLNMPRAEYNPQADYRRLSGILGAIIDFSQEAMVLKSKKTFRAVDSIVSVRNRENAGRYAQKITDEIAGNRDSLYSVLSDSMASFRRDYQRNLEAEFGEGGSMDKLGFGTDQARILSQFLNPGIVLTMTRGDGSTYRVVVDATCFYGPNARENFEARMDDIMEVGAEAVGTPKIIAADVLTVTMHEAAARVQKATSDFNAGKTGPINSAEVESVATDAINNWNDYSENLVQDVNGIMSTIAPLGYTRRSRITALDSPTPVQWFFNQVSEGRSSAMVDTVDRSNLRFYDPEEMRWRQPLITRDVLHLDRPVLKSFISNAEPNAEQELRDMHHDLRAVQGSEGDNVMRSGYGIAYVVGDDSLLDRKITEGIAWAQRTGNLLLVPSRVVDRYRYLGSNAITSTRRTMHGIEFTAIDPSQTDRFWQARQNQPTSETVEGDISRINMAIVVDSSMYNMGDAEMVYFPNMDGMTVRRDKRPSQSISTYFSNNPNNAPKELINRVTASRLLDKVADQNPATGRWEPKPGDWTNIVLDDGSVVSFDLRAMAVKNAGISTESDRQIKQLIVKYLCDMRENVSLPYDARPTDPKRSEVAGIISDGTVLAPVLYPKDMPTYVYYSDVRISNGNVIISYSGESRLHEEGLSSSQKWMLQGETFKGMASRHRGAFVPKILGSDQQALEASFMVSADTEGSRVANRNLPLLKNALYYLSRKRHSSLFFDGDGYSQHIMENWDPEDRRQLGQGVDDTFWMRVVSGELTLTDDLDTNRYLQDVILQCVRSKVDPVHLFSTYKIVENQRTGEIYKMSLGDDPNDMDSYKDVNFQMVFRNFNADQMLKIYHAMDPHLCSDGINDSRERGEYVIDRNGMSLVQMRDGGGWMTLPVRYGYHQVLGDTTQETAPSGTSAVSMQHAGRRAMDKGYMDAELQRAINYEDFLFGNNDNAMQDVLDRIDEARRKKVRLTPTTIPGDMSLASMYTYGTMREMRRVARVSELFHNMWTVPRVIETADGKKIGERTVDSEGIVDWRKTSVANAVNRLNAVLDKPLTFQQIQYLTMMLEGSSYTGDNANWKITEAQLVDAIEHLAKNMESSEDPMPIKVPYESSEKANGRFAIPLVPREMANWIWNSSKPEFRAYYDGNINEFIEAMRREQDRAEKAIASLDESVSANKSRKKALIDMCDAARLQYNDTSSITPCYEDYSFQQLDKDARSLYNALVANDDMTPEERALFDEWCAASEEKLHEVRRYLTSLGYRTKDIEGVTGGMKAWSKQDEARAVSKVLNNAAELSKVMAILNPFVTVANIADRTIHQGTMNLTLQTIHRLKMGGLNPYAKETWLDQDIVEKAVNDPIAIELYASYRAAEFNSEEMLFIANAMQSKNLQSIREFMANRRKNLTKFQRFTEWAYQVGSGGNFRLKGQMRNFINRFVMFAEEEGQDFWFEPTDLVVTDDKGNERNLNRMEAILQSPGGFSQFFLECIGAKGATPSYSIAMKAMNSAKTGDMAQKNAVGLVISDICRRMPFGKFLMTTCVSRFPMYGINVTGRMLNWVLPVSTMNYVFTEYLADTNYGRRIGVEETQIHRSLREAMLIDVMKLGVGGTAIALFAITGAIQPPDDEKKWGNIDEWMVFGTRAGENWWVQDILGMSLPLAAFWKSAEAGKPRFDIITNGVAQTCYSNPILRCADVASFLIDPTESLVSDYNEDVIQFQKAKGGPPSFSQYLQANAFSLGTNWASQFVTPSIVREWYQAATPFEKSYKKIYEQSPSGKLTEAGQEGKMVYTTYDDAMKRKLARRNPVLAALFEFTNGTSTSYWGPNMPDNVYYDDYQLASMDYTSVSGLEGTDRMAKVVDIIATLQSYDDMNQLAAEGFHLDYETLAAVSAQVWDNYHAADEWYYGLQADGMLNYYTLGGGDYATGQAMAGQLKQEWQNQKQYWYDFYYQKLKNSPISGELVTYNRYNTTYARDVYGDVYATGIQKSPLDILPFTNAPGTIESAENTAGYGNDFATVSAVTGLPMDQRALVPNDAGNVDLPDFEYWSGDGEGNTYSAQYQTIYGEKGDTSSKKNNYGNGTGGTGSGRGGYGGGGGYRRRSGGGGSSRRSSGGSGYTPSTSAPSVRAPITSASLPRTSLSKVNPSRIMGSDRLVEANEQYLRPDFETKGSREAYKRSDI